MYKKIIIISGAAILLAGVGTAGAILTSKKAKMRRFAKRAGKTMYSIGTMLQALSGQAAIGEN